MNYSELYDPAMEVQTKEEAEACFKVIQDRYSEDGVYPEISEKIIKTNLGYWAAYGNAERRERIEHPIFGSIKEMGSPTTKEAFDLGMNRAMKVGPQTLGELRKK